MNSHDNINNKINKEITINKTILLERNKRNHNKLTSYCFKHAIITFEIKEKASDFELWTTNPIAKKWLDERESQGNAIHPISFAII